ncbi:hypothetical protein V8G54_026993 [Vigna mungo]|uniref:Uncharacterized protein n=1 Tax=Vigna mungo TaxID=3915 RepID=A0AAQ3RMN3_VIGMU
MPVVMVNGEQLGDSKSPKPQNDEGINGTIACEARINLCLCYGFGRLNPLNFMETSSSVLGHRNYFTVLSYTADDTTSFWGSGREGNEMGLRQDWCEYGKDGAKRRNSSHGSGSEDCVCVV